MTCSCKMLGFFSLSVFLYLFCSVDKVTCWGYCGEKRRENWDTAFPSAEHNARREKESLSVLPHRCSLYVQWRKVGGTKVQTDESARCGLHWWRQEFTNILHKKITLGTCGRWKDRNVIPARSHFRSISRQSQAHVTVFQSCIFFKSRGVSPFVVWGLTLLHEHPIWSTPAHPSPSVFPQGYF